MRFLCSILLLFALLSCKSKPPEITGTEQIKMWQITNYLDGETEYFPGVVQEAFITSNLETNKTYVNYLLNEVETAKLQEIWAKKYKKISLDAVIIFQEIKYTLEGSTLKIDSVITDFVIKGDNTKLLSNKINEIVKTERKKESIGGFGLLYQIWNPTVVAPLIFPELKVGKYEITKNAEFVELILKDTKIQLLYIGNHRWIGF
ncbi:MAG: hypothetical protein OCD02_14265 [Spirochaetaceae bacterium]